MLIEGDSEEQLPDIVGFEIVDNGIGFDADNYSSFETSDSTWKQDRGAKGVGRFLWLKAFGTSYIESVFASNAGRKREKRTFHFRLPDGISDHSTISVADDTTTGTKLSLQGFYETYQRNCPKRMEAIADRVIDHCFVRLLKSDCPTIVIKDGIRGSISLNERFRERVRETGEAKTIDVNKCALSVKHFHILALSSEHRIVYCAHEREVTSEKPESPDLSKRLRNGDGDYFVVNTCVSGDILDQSVNQERTGFNLDGAGDVLPGTLTLGQLKNAANREVVEHLKPQLDDVRELKLREYRKHIEREAPQYRPLLKRENELLDLPPGLTAEKLDLELHKIKSRIEVETKKKVSNLIKDVTTFDEYRENYASLLEQVNDLGKAALTEHVVHRRLVLGILKKKLEFQDTERYSLEENIHQIIFPLRSDSYDVLFEQQNLWIIDEKLTFHRYLASDTRLDKQETHEGADRQRPDLVIWNNPFSLSEEDSVASLNSVTIIEFKQPGKKDYNDDKNPVAQVYNYVDRIKVGRAKSHAGRVLTVRENTPFYAYILCDLFPHLRKLIENYGLTPTPDGSGYCGYNPNLKCYIEVISYEKMLEDARKRNRAFFEKLQIP